MGKNQGIQGWVKRSILHISTSFKAEAEYKKEPFCLVLMEHKEIGRVVKPLMGIVVFMWAVAMEELY